MLQPPACAKIHILKVLKKVGRDTCWFEGLYQIFRLAGEVGHPFVWGQKIMHIMAAPPSIYSSSSTFSQGQYVQKLNFFGTISKVFFCPWKIYLSDSVKPK